MDEIDKNIKVRDCTFLLLTKLPNGNLHQVVIRQDELRDWLMRRDKFEVYGETIENFTFTIPALQ